MAATRSTVSPPSTAQRSCSCSSSKVDLSVGNRKLSRMPCLAQQDVQRGKIGVPLHQGGQGAETPERLCVEVPYRLRYSGAVVVNQDLDPVGGMMPGEMNLADRFQGQRIEIGDRVEPE